jgi:hypothetical protein
MRICLVFRHEFSPNFHLVAEFSVSSEAEGNSNFGFASGYRASSPSPPDDLFGAGTQVVNGGRL